VSGLFAALQFLTRIPVPRGDYKLEHAYVWLAPVGLLLGAILALADIALRALPLSSLLISVLLVVLWEALTGALHADGLMDTCDAVFGHAEPDRRLDIMRDPHTGAFGVVGIVCMLLLKVAAVEALPTSTRPQALVLAPTLVRWSIALLSAAFPYGRPGGLGAPLKAAATPRRLAVATLVALLACLAAWPIGSVLGAAVLVLAWLLGSALMRVLPGLTGDCYGAVCEVVETVVLVGAAPLAHALT
jgi:adenosylcobinamide-GDP ribazoletransferase